MNEQMITDYIRTRHADLIAEATAERTATAHLHPTNTPSTPTNTPPTPANAPSTPTNTPSTPANAPSTPASGPANSRSATSPPHGSRTLGSPPYSTRAATSGGGLRRRAARALHTLANAIDPHPTTP
ncbi:hypothetical protein ACIBEJ_28070 [Nonomuraea sp. NPDC050790]|uniref:hypothetical protein n=1 Tax=Nonomuraea sp. NPDC050790 TaxID=3364371 RepID=UPI0037B6B9CF